MQKKYCGERTERGGSVAVVNRETREARPLPVGLQYVNHSPNGFEWGYLGSGPAQLSFAILLDHFGDPGPARAFYQAFKFDVIAGLHHTVWELTSEQVAEAIAKIQERLGREESA